MAMASRIPTPSASTSTTSLGLNVNTRIHGGNHQVPLGGTLNLQVGRLRCERLTSGYSGSWNVSSRRGQIDICGVASGEPGEVPVESSDGENELESSASGILSPQEQEERRKTLTSWWKNWKTNASEMRAQVAKLGLAAVLAYGLFDGVTYTTFFVLAFLGYEKSTGQNPAANLKALLGVVILMWTGNNVTRPLRVAGAAALAPLIDRFLKKTQEVLKLPNQAFAFMIVVASFASLCFSVVGLLILSRLGR